MIKSWLVFLSVFVSSFFVPSFYKTNIKFVMIYVLIILFIFSVVTILSSVTFLNISCELHQSKSLKEEEVKYIIKVQNRGPFFYPAIFYKFSNSEFMKAHNVIGSFNISPFKKEDKTYTVKIPYSGYYAIGLEKIVVSDLLGLFKRTININMVPYLLVLPDSDKMFSLEVREDIESVPMDVRSYTENYEDVIDVKAYVPEDSLKRVHWKLSAKKNELLVKNYPSMATRSIMMFVDGKSVDLQDYLQRLAFQDGIKSSVSAAVISAAQIQQKTELVYSSSKIDIKSLDDVNYAFEQIAKMSFNSLRSDILGLAEKLDEGSSSMTIMIFTAYLDIEVFDAIRRILVLDHKIFLYYFHHEQLHQDIEKTLKNLQTMGAETKVYPISLPKLHSGVEGGEVK